MVYLYIETLNSNENKWTTATCNNMNETNKHNIEWNRLHTQEWKIMIPLVED